MEVREDNMEVQEETRRISLVSLVDVVVSSVEDGTFL